MSAIVVQDLTFQYRPGLGLDGVTFAALPGELVGVFVSDGLTLAVIGEQIHKAGNVTGNGDPETNWVVQEVRNDSVVLRYGNQTAVLEMRSASEAGKARPAGRGGSR